MKMCVLWVRFQGEAAGETPSRNSENREKHAYRIFEQAEAKI